jgi:hypothetical protein
LPRKIQIQAAPANLGPRLDRLVLRVQHGVAFGHWDLALLDPLTIEISLDPPAAADVGGTKLHVTGGLLRGRHRRRAAQKRQRREQLPPRYRTRKQSVK